MKYKTMFCSPGLISVIGSHARIVVQRLSGVQANLQEVLVSWDRGSKWEMFRNSG